MLELTPIIIKKAKANKLYSVGNPMQLYALWHHLCHLFNACCTIARGLFHLQRNLGGQMARYAL